MARCIAQSLTLPPAAAAPELAGGGGRMRVRARAAFVVQGGDVSPVRTPYLRYLLPI